MGKKIEIPSNAIIMLVGIAGSGKSTFAQKVFRENALIVSSDECRKEISGNEADQTVTEEAFKLFYKKIADGVKMGGQVVADATNLDKFSREEIYQIARENGVPVYALIFNIPFDVIKKQNRMRERVVPEYALERMFKKMEMTYYAIEDELPKGHVIDIIMTDKSAEKSKTEDNIR